VTSDRRHAQPAVWDVSRCLLEVAGTVPQLVRRSRSACESSHSFGRQRNQFSDAEYHRQSRLV